MACDVAVVFLAGTGGRLFRHPSGARKAASRCLRWQIILNPPEFSMATIYTHAVVGLGMGKVFTSRRLRSFFWVLAGLLPIVPDFDSFSPYSYGSMWGHRGFTHSLCFALGIGLIAAAAAFRYLRISFWPLFGFFLLIRASHGILDALTDGGFGIPFFWPFSPHRYGPYGPIHVADIGFEIPDPRVSRSVRTELLYVWLPLAVLVGLVVTYRILKRTGHKAGC
jgi:inner membrane protein